MKKRIVIISLLIILILLILLTHKKDSIFTGKEIEKYALGEIIKKQKEMDKEIDKLKGNKSFTLENPKIIVNPYELAPLTALIIFTTPDNSSVKVYVNDKLMTTVESTKDHLVPVYGLNNGKDNKVKLTLDNNESKEFTIETEKYTGDIMKVEKTSDSLDDSLYFLSPNFVENCIYDKNGNLLWYIKGDYAGDIRYLDNGHFYISDPYQGTNGVKINYASFLEMDYFGKIYKQYITDYGYHHEIVELSNNKILTLGAKDGSRFFEGVLYIMEKKSGKVLDYIDMYEYLHDIAPEWIESLGNNFDFVLNSVSYDDKTNDVVISCRGIGVIMRLNLTDKKIKWMFGDPKNLPEEFKEYLLKVTDNTKYPYGEHSAIILENGNIAFHNNDADQFNMKSEKLTDYLDKYTTNVIVQIDEKNKTLHTVWEYDADKKEFSKVAGYINFLNNKNVLLTYGWSITQDAYKNPRNITINDTNYLNGVIVELDENNNVLFRGTTKGLLYRVYKMKFYKDNTPNYKTEKYVKIDGTRFNGKAIKTKTIRNRLVKAKEFDGEFDVLINRIVINTKMKEEDEIKVLFVGEKGDSYLYTYKEKGIMPRKFNTDMAGALIHIKKGDYKPYVIINDIYYDTNTKMIFE